MKTIYKVLALLMPLLFLGVCLVPAQTVKLHLKGGDVLQYNTADVDSIVFDAPDEVCPKFSLQYSKLTSTTVTLNVVPDNDTVRYYFDLVTKEQLASSDNNIASVVEGYISYLQETYPTLSLTNILDALLSKGPAADDLSSLPAATDFIFYAIAVDDNGKCYGDASTVTFTTLPGGDPADCSFTIDYANLSSEGLTVKVTPSDASVRYWMGICSVDEYPGDYAMTVNVKSEIAAYAADKGMTVEQVVKGVTFLGETSTQESGLQANTDYYVYVYAMDNTGAGAGKVYKKKFYTRSADYSDADISLKYRYFDGDALYAMDAEKFANVRGRVYVQAVVTPNDAATNWALALASSDLSDETTYPEESTKNAVLQGGYLNVTSKNLIADWKTCTFLYFAADENGIDGELHRLVVTFDKENARPVSEYSDTEESAAASAKTLRIPARLAPATGVAKRMGRNAVVEGYRERAF